jgi:hypothetical protein
MSNITHLEYASVAALRHEAQNVPCKRQANQAVIAKVLSRKASPFTSGFSSDELMAMLRDGYPEGEMTIRAFHDKITADLPRALGHNRTRIRGVSGDELDIHTMNNGAFDKAWSTSARRIKKGSGILRLCVDVCANGSADAYSLRWRGIAGLALAEVMIRAGYSVEIVAALAVSNFTRGQDHFNMTATIVVKPRTSQADYGMLAATVALPAFFRTLGFCAIARAADNIKKSVEDGLGQYLDVSRVLPVPDKITQLFVPAEVTSEANAVKWVKQSITLLQGATT